jgi:uncharacterized protein
MPDEFLPERTYLMMGTDALKEAQLISLLSHSILDLHILPTEKCNFRCIYCYENFQIGKMKKEVITGVKNLISRRMDGLKQLRLSWFGGEPLAATEVILDISHYAKDLAVRNICFYHFGMTTNGYLLDQKRFAQVFNAGITAFQISLDGTQVFHDQTRLRADGSGTFKTIWNNLLGMASTNKQFEVVLRVHVTPDNYRDIYGLLDQIKLDFGSDNRFSVFLKAIANLGGANAGTFETLTGKNKNEILKQLNDHLGNTTKKHELHKNGLDYVCYASAQNAWVVRADGSLAKCTVAFDDDRNNVGKLLENGSLELDQDKIQLWLRGLKTMDASIMGCPLHKLPKLVIGQLKNIPVVALS